jgi:signal transduction histidine kinase
VLLVSGWLTVALAATGLFVVALVQANAERELRALLLAHAYNIMGAAEVNAAGELEADPGIRDPHFALPNSGWYWAIVRAEELGTPLVTSASLAGDSVPAAVDPDIPFDSRFQRLVQSQVTEDTEERLEAQVYLGDAETLYTVIVAANRNVVTGAVGDVLRILVLAFLLLIIGTVVVTHLAVRRGLRPLAEAQDAVNAMRAGQQVQLSTDVPKEITPLVEEINALAEANRATLERARHQVGNLAHAMKTPLAAALNEVETVDEPQRERLRQQLGKMREQMSSYLDRAQRGAVREGTSHHTMVLPVVESVNRVLAKLNPEKLFDAKTLDTALAVRCEEDDLAELLGTIVENAARHSKSIVDVEIAAASNSAHLVEIAISDDGAGLDDAAKAKALDRGKRLDSSGTGSGLGLSIVQEIAEDYSGEIHLENSALGGLKVVVFLPRSAP